MHLKLPQTGNAQHGSVNIRVSLLKAFSWCTLKFCKDLIKRTTSLYMMNVYVPPLVHITQIGR